MNVRFHHDAGQERWKWGTNLKRVVMVLCLIVFGQMSSAQDWEERPELADLFRKAEVQGTFVLYDLNADQFVGYDHSRAETRFVPASTFKIANTLIGLSTGSVASVDEVLPYGGEPQFLPQWERDMGLREAISVSNVAIYRELARRIGLVRMQEGVNRLDYGNRQIGTVVDQFWLKGPLKISAIEQTVFLAGLAQGSLPMDARLQESVRDILLLEKQGSRSLYGKTGWENAPQQGIGWWVGWVERNGRIHAFALNLDVRAPRDADIRVPLGKACLQALGVL